MAFILSQYILYFGPNIWPSNIILTPGPTIWPSVITLTFASFVNVIFMN